MLNFHRHIMVVYDINGYKISDSLQAAPCYTGLDAEDLRQLGRPMERVVLVDNSPVSLALCLDNGVIVSSWTEPVCFRFETHRFPFRGGTPSRHPCRYRWDFP